MAVVEATEPTATSAPRRDVPPSMVERMTLILDAFEGRSSRLTLEEVACRTRLPRSTVHRILDQLVKLNWVDHASFGYCLGRRALDRRLPILRDDLRIDPRPGERAVDFPGAESLAFHELGAQFDERRVAVHLDRRRRGPRQEQCQQQRERTGGRGHGQCAAMRRWV